ncbi:MAG: hypothetical protein WD431_19160 [Cyclobacteriaceae bacterium]
MTKKLLFTGLFITLFQWHSKAQFVEEIKTAGQIYAYAQLHGDHEILLDFTYPILIEKAGGREAMKNILKQIQETKKRKGSHLRVLEFEDPIEITSVKDEVHALVPFTTISEVPGGTLTTEASLIAVGTENRENWYFIEMTALDEGNIQKVIPLWDYSLTLPYKKPPVFKENKH